MRPQKVIQIFSKAFALTKGIETRKTRIGVNSFCLFIIYPLEYGFVFVSKILHEML